MGGRRMVGARAAAAIGLLASMGAVACGGSGSGASGRIQGPDGSVLTPSNPDAGVTISADGGTGLHATALHLPANTGGDIPVTAMIDGVQQGTVQLAVELSPDNGSSFRPATVKDVAASPPSGAQAQVRFTWDATHDLGVRAIGTIPLRVTPSDGAGAGTPVTFGVPVDNLRAAARRVDHYIANYGTWDEGSFALAQHTNLVIAHPGNGDLHRGDIQRLQAGAKADDPTDDVIVLCYVSVGEDMRTHDVADDQLRKDPRFVGDGSGPRVDPRGPDANGGALAGVDPKGAPSNGGTGFASFYLDDNDVRNSPNHVGDGIPDRNQIFGALFVNAGDPAWYPIVDAMTMDGPDRLAGLREVLTPDYGRGLDCDGVFLDTIDTAAPDAYTDASSPNESKYEWTAPGFATFIRQVHQSYPNKLVLQNRGLFFFDPRRPQYPYNARGAVDFVLFESFRLNSNAGQPIDPVEYPDNRYNVAPRLMAEANRPDGFRVLSLGYAGGAGTSTATLTGGSSEGSESLLEDIRVTQAVNGFRHYLTDAKVRLVNDFVAKHDDLTDHDAPVWSSTYNDHDVSPAVPATPRVGIQKAAGAGGQITVWWDVALDMNRVSYILYAQPQPFDFAGHASLDGASRYLLTPSVPQDYVQGVGPDRYPYQATVSGFAPGQTQYLVIRAVDQSPDANEETNTVTLTATP
jgi:hypothetical protein